MAAERLTSNPEIKAMTKHSADVTELHLQLIDVVTSRVSDKLDEAPSPEYQSGYMSPFVINVHGKSSNGSSSSSSSSSSSH